MLEDVREAFVEVFDVDPSEVTKETTVDNLDEWDSMQHLQLVMALENKFDIKFSMDQITDFDSVEKILSHLSQIKEAA